MLTTDEINLLETALQQASSKLRYYCVLEEKSISRINRLTPYYYLITAEEDFEVDKNRYSFSEIGKPYKIVYTPQSKTILSIGPN